MNTCSGETLPQSDEGDGNGAPAIDGDDDVDDGDAGDGDGSDGDGGSDSSGEDDTKHGKDEENIIRHSKLICLMNLRPSQINIHSHNCVSISSVIAQALISKYINLH